MKVSLKKTVVASAILATVMVGSLTVPAFASSHREGPFIANQPKVDGTDLYMFRSYELGRQDYVTLIANYIPFQDPQGGPNFFQFDQNAMYEIHIDNVGDGKEKLSFQFRFNNASKRTTFKVGGKDVLIPLINSGPVSSVNDANLNVRETYTVDMVKGDRRSGSKTRLDNGDGSGNVFDKPVDNIGDKTFNGTSGYETYANKHIYPIKFGTCGNGRVFVGQRKESFYIAIGKVFDLVNLNPLGAETDGNKNDLEGKNVSSIALEVPISCLTAGNEPVISAYTTASMRQGRLLNPSPASGLNNAIKEGASFSQVSRLGMPLVNELVIGMDDKDRFNTSKPTDDGQFITYVTNPTLPALIETLFPAAKAPTNFPRTDLVAAFLTGIAGVNQPQNVKASEMLRLNTAIPATMTASQNPLGVAAGDNAGFPNGRRPGDDVVDVSLRVAMGALCALTGANDALKVGCKPADAPAGGLPLTDGVRKNASTFKSVFPYLNTPLPGNN